MNEEIPFPKQYSVIRTQYLGYIFYIPLYPWEELAPYWDSIAIAISKTLVYEKFSDKCYKDHKLWRETRMGLEALRFADFLTRDRGFRKAVTEFNAQAPMKFGGDWLKPFDTGQSVNFSNHIAQLGQLIYNSVKFLKDAKYLNVYGTLVKVMRPYWCPPSQWALERDWGKKTCEFIYQYVRDNKKHPPLRKIAEHWSVPRYVLIEAGYTMDVIKNMYRHHRKTGEIKIIKPEKEYKRLSEEEQRQLAVKIAKRVYLH